jgi:ppGpp synthetase/RelA/SpoT-type nucleotidyltranferase
MEKPIELDNFLANNRISQETWECAAIDWRNLQGIAEDHENQLESLRGSAELFARVIQRFTGVHSVRWRIKDKEHLLEKIIRKRAEGNKKYDNISPENYFETVTDLIGLRALHLFKDECFVIDECLRNTWATTENPIAYVREGDPEDMTLRFKERDFEVKKHPAGYRSVHYVCSTKPFQRQVFAEIQVRTIFEEGWSEIDHRVRYPNFSDDQLVAYFLTIFNRMAGSADEMGTFVQNLTGARQKFNSELSDANRKKEEALSAVERTLAELKAKEVQGAEAILKISTLQQEVAKLRTLSSARPVLDTKYLAEFAFEALNQKRTSDIGAEYFKSPESSKILSALKSIQEKEHLQSRAKLLGSDNSLLKFAAGLARDCGE